MDNHLNHFKHLQDLENQVIRLYGPNNEGERDVVELLEEVLKHMSLYGLGAILERVSALVVAFADYGDGDLVVPNPKERKGKS